MTDSSLVADPGGLGPARPSSLTRLWQIVRIVLLVWLGLVAFIALTQRRSDFSAI